jgi:hypothetical protein
MKNKILKNKIADELRKLGIKVKEDARIKGDSGIVHRFDLRVHNELNKTAVIDIAKNKPTDEVTILNMQIKLYDTNLIGLGIILSERFTMQAKKLACSYKISLVEGKRIKRLIKGLKDALSRILDISS